MPQVLDWGGQSYELRHQAHFRKHHKRSLWASFLLEGLCLYSTTASFIYAKYILQHHPTNLGTATPAISMVIFKMVACLIQLRIIQMIKARTFYALRKAMGLHIFIKGCQTVMGLVDCFMVLIALFITKGEHSMLTYAGTSLAIISVLYTFAMMVVTRFVYFPHIAFYDNAEKLARQNEKLTQEKQEEYVKAMARSNIEIITL
uniref:Integral membrane protein n=1 Tax=Caenorhabditis tropicalis TaxID=1561998 RepID=A0A1I7USD4_9PELO